jgi:hypothetical protein
MSKPDDKSVETNGPPLDPRQLRSCFGQFATGLTVVSYEADFVLPGHVELPIVRRTERSQGSIGAVQRGEPPRPEVQQCAPSHPVHKARLRHRQGPKPRGRFAVESRPRERDRLHIEPLPLLVRRLRLDLRRVRAGLALANNRHPNL